MKHDDPRLKNEDGLLGWFEAETHKGPQQRLVREHGNFHVSRNGLIWKRTKGSVSESIFDFHIEAVAKASTIMGPPQDIKKVFKRLRETFKKKFDKTLN